MNRLKELPEYDRPYEKALSCGTAALTDAELLAILLRTGTPEIDVLSLSASLLNMDGEQGGLPGLLNKSFEEFLKVPGIGRVKAVQLLALSELVKRIWRRSAEQKPLSFLSPRVCAHYYMQELRHLPQEELRVVYLDTRCRRTGECILSRGTVNFSVISVREIFASALKRQAVSIILLHNHPSGSPAPSDEDIQVTEQIREAGELLGVPLSDHIIIGDNCYYSFKESGTL